MDLHVVERGSGPPLLVLHGAGVDHREPLACFEPLLEGSGLRRLYPDLPGHGRSAAGEVRSADDVLATLVGLAPDEPFLVAGHSAGAYYARGLAASLPDRVAGLALVCPLLPEVRDVPPHEPVVRGELGDAAFRDYFVVQTPEMLQRHTAYVEPGAALADRAALERIGERWELAADRLPAYDGVTLVVAGRQDSVVGYAAATDLLARPRTTVAVLDGAGHALPHEQPGPLGALLADWVRRTGLVT